MDPTGSKVDRLLRLYPKVDESETPLPRTWSNKDKYTYIGLSQSNLKVHYKGMSLVCVLLEGVLIASRAFFCCVDGVQVVGRTTRTQPQFELTTPSRPLVASTTLS